MAKSRLISSLMAAVIVGALTLGAPKWIWLAIAATAAVLGYLFPYV